MLAHARRPEARRAPVTAKAAIGYAPPTDRTCGFTASRSVEEEGSGRIRAPLRPRRRRLHNGAVLARLCPRDARVGGLPAAHAASQALATVMHDLNETARVHGMIVRLLSGDQSAETEIDKLHDKETTL